MNLRRNLTGRLRGPRMVAVWIVGAVIALVAATAGVGVHRAAQPSYCAASCHVEVSADAQHARHDSTKCQDCHSQGTGLGLWLADVLDRTPPAHGGVTDADCSRCHNELDDSRWRLTSATEGHSKHTPETTETSCLQCHSEHRAQRAVDRCTDCHDNVQLHQVAVDMGGTQCVGCHEFRARREGEPPAKDICGRCHEDQQRRADGGLVAAVDIESLHGKVGCKLCHSPHGDAKTKNLECRSCHALKDTGDIKEHQGCEGCHKPHAPLKEATSRCAECHEQSKPKDGLVTTALEHDKGCGTCHAPHSWKADKRGCKSCHEETAKLVSTKSQEGHGSCQSCHSPHEAAPSSATCVGCHNQVAYHVGAAPQGHAQCTGCHEPHTGAAAACSQCHQKQGGQVHAGPQPHQRSCLTCHQNHGAPLASIKVCANCHANQVALVSSAGTAEHSTCASCHQPHNFNVASPITTCNRCHKEVSQAGAHMGGCEKCHSTHGSKTVVQAACKACHQDIPLKAKTGKHAACSSCHAPHQKATVAAAACRACHEDKATVAASWPKGAHSAACNGCHDQHNVLATPACGSCHAKEAAQDKRGSKHTCSGCHQPHAPPGAWWNKCASCHKSEQLAVRSRGPKHSSCANCHAPHGFASPSCNSCHADVGKLASHAVKEHRQNCNACHATHASTRPSPDQCLACHEDMKNHQRQAPRCYSCHLFK